MATSRTAPTAATRGRRAPPDDGEPLAVSPARWIGVALVLGALVTAMTMAATSAPTPRTVPDTAAAGAASPSPSPAAFVAGEGVPSEVPGISLAAKATRDAGGALLTNERDAALSITVPQTVLPTRRLGLQILHDGEIAQTIPRPGEKEQPRPITLREGPNVLAARLTGPGGFGPAAELRVVLDTLAPSLRVTAPRENHSTGDDSVLIRGDSDPGTRLVVVNRKTDKEATQTVGPAGTWEEIVFLEPGENVIRVKAIDQAGNVSDEERTATREGAGVRAQLSVQPRRLAVRDLPASVRITARLLDKDKKPVEDAQVTFTLSIPGQPTRPSPKISTGPDGVAVWKPQVAPEGIEKGSAQITVDAKLPTGARVTADLERLIIE